MADLAYREVYTMSRIEARLRLVNSYYETGSICQTASRWCTSQQVSESGSDGMTPRVSLAWKISPAVLAPLNQILFFTFLGTFATGRDTASFYAIGNAIQLTAMSGIYGVTMSVGRERNEGTLIYLFGSPANRLLAFLGRALVHVLDGMIGQAIGLVWAGLLLGVDYSQADLLALGLTVFITTVSTSGLGYRHYIEATIFGYPLLKVNERYLDSEARMELPVGIVENKPKVDIAANLGLRGNRCGCRQSSSPIRVCAGNPWTQRPLAWWCPWRRGRTASPSPSIRRPG